MWEGADGGICTHVYPQLKDDLYEGKLENAIKKR